MLMAEGSRKVGKCICHKCPEGSIKIHVVLRNHSTQLRGQDEKCGETGRMGKSRSTRSAFPKTGGSFARRANGAPQHIDNTWILERGDKSYVPHFYGDVGRLGAGASGTMGGFPEDPRRLGSETLRLNVRDDFGLFLGLTRIDRCSLEI